MANVYDDAYRLEKAIRNSDDFKRLKQLHSAIYQDQTAKQKFIAVRKKQLALQEKQLSGKHISESELQQLSAQMNALQQNKRILQFLEQEKRLSTMLSDLNKIILKPLEDLYRL